MLLTDLSRYTALVPPKYYSKITGYVQTLSQEYRYTLHRYARIPPEETLGVRMLMSFIQRFHTDEAMKLPSDFKRYRECVEPRLEGITHSFDPVQTGIYHMPWFVNPASKCQELTFPVSSGSPYSDYPFSRGWDAWSKCRPFRLVSITTQELTFHAYLDLLTYRNDSPSRAVFTLDVGMLAMMYWSYLDSGGSEPLAHFLHHYVVYPALLEDNIQLWIRDRYMETFTKKLVTDQTHKDYVWLTANNGRIGSQFPQFMEDAHRLTDLTRGGEISANTFLCSATLMGGISLRDTFMHLAQTVQFPSLRQYRWCSYLAYEQWYDLLIQLICLNPQWKDFSYTAQYLLRDFKLLTESRPWDQINNVGLKTYLQSSLEDKVSRLSKAYTG